MNPTNQPLPQHQSMEQQEHQARIAKNHKAWSCQGNQGSFPHSCLENKKFNNNQKQQTNKQ